MILWFNDSVRNIIYWEEKGEIYIFTQRVSNIGWSLCPKYVRAELQWDLGSQICWCLSLSLYTSPICCLYRAGESAGISQVGHGSKKKTNPKKKNTKKTPNLHPQRGGIWRNSLFLHVLTHSWVYSSDEQRQQLKSCDEHDPQGNEDSFWAVKFCNETGT